MFNFSAISLGCTKNLVDTQYVIGKLLSLDNADEKVNWISDPYSDLTEYVFLNTCGFLSSARAEAMQTLKKLVKAGKKVYVLGCAVQYFRWKSDEVFRGNQMKSKVRGNEIKYEKELESFNNFLENNKKQVFLLSWEDINKIDINKIKKGYNSKHFGGFVYPKGVRAYTNVAYGYEYLKIAEGCNNSCSFCIIPKIRGKQKSLPMEKILSEAKSIIKAGAKELIIIAQDTTRYGVDLYQEPKLFELLEKVDQVKGDFVYRVLYFYPDILTLKYLENLKHLKRLLPYFDIPLQHISNKILKSMGRFYDTDYIYKFLDFIKKNFPGAFIRTNFIIGFPGETDKDFKKLIDFIKQDWFDNIALFQYHDEPLAASSKLPNKIDDKTLNYRFGLVSKLVDDLLERKNKKRRKQKQFGYVQNFNDKEIIVRPYLHCPEIDPIDTIKFSNITGVYNKTGIIDIGELIEYKL